ncbi:MAG: hypothetical protein JXX14_17350 [Deltaproteobacteria bacterium]|nr:hypothetical protein [Deltaproteobacteria bacterium]
MKRRTLLGRGIVGVLGLSLMLASAMAFADKGAGENNSDKVAEAKQKAQEAMNKLKADAEQVGAGDMEDAKKQANEKWSKGKEALNKKLEEAKQKGEEAKQTAKEKSEEAKQKLKEKNEAAEAKAAGGSGDSGKHLAKGQTDENPGKHLGQEKQAEKDASADTDSAAESDVDSEATNRRRRREMGYMMHKRYLETNEEHMKLMKKVSDKKGLRAKEQRKHIKRIARLERMKELAADTGDTKTIARIENLQQREIERYGDAMVKLHKQEKQAVQNEKEEGK